MFERKNQSVLTAHYSGMVRHDDQQEADDDDDFLTIGQRNHTLADVGLGPVDGEGEGAAGSGTAALMIPSAELSKRKLKMGESKKAMLKMKGTGHKIQFDDEGGAHEVYEMQGLDEFEGKGDAARQREEYVKEEMEKMKEADIVDRQVAREKRLDKKRKRKEREREVSLGTGLVWLYLCEWIIDCLLHVVSIFRRWKRQWARHQFLVEAMTRMTRMRLGSRVTKMKKKKRKRKNSFLLVRRPNGQHHRILKTMKRLWRYDCCTVDTGLRGIWWICIECFMNLIYVTVCFKVSFFPVNSLGRRSINMPRLSLVLLLASVDCI